MDIIQGDNPPREDLFPSQPMGPIIGKKSFLLSENSAYISNFHIAHHHICRLACYEDFSIKNRRFGARV